MSKSSQEKWDELPNSEKKKTIIAFVVTLLIFSVIVLLFTGENSSGVLENGQRKYDAAVTSSKVDNPSSLIIAFDVSNNTDKTAEPFCSISAADRSSTYKGSATKQMPPILPRQTKGAFVSMTITNQGALYISNATVTCVD